MGGSDLRSIQSGGWFGVEGPKGRCGNWPISVKGELKTSRPVQLPAAFLTATFLVI